MKNIENSKEIAKEKAIFVDTYEELVEKIANISYENQDNIMYFRGQNQEYLNSSGNTTIYPSIYRGTLSALELKNRFQSLNDSAKLLIKVAKEHKYKGILELNESKEIQWSMLEHYKICNTPYLDITLSLMAACSFATMDSNLEYGYLYVLEFPKLPRQMIVDEEEELLVIKLSNIFSPDAKRPYYQEGFMAATRDITDDYKKKSDLDFKSRLLFKYKFPNDKSFWNEDFSPLKKKFLYPEDDKCYRIAQEVKTENRRAFKNDRAGDFLFLWNELDEILRANAKYNKYVSLANILQRGLDSQFYSETFCKEVEYLNSFRNILVYKRKEVNSIELEIQITNIKSIVDEFKLINNINR